ncbi:UNC93-like protein 3 [Rhododendron vialii]|uniref:UNC93-like protein 3 n=1 Tax=Rhododendron vialii TaxID=182163 RepID=UPI0026602D56|nr:UNC93-like protein 3 [Rhododendron vialii]
MDEEAPLLAETTDSKTPAKNHTRDVHILSSAFLLIFLAYSAAQNLESTINTEEDLGTISLGILYSSFTVFSLVASLVVRYLGSKNALVLGTTGYWLFIAANLKPTWYTMVPASLYLGFAASIIWVAEGTYITSTARSHAHDCNLHEGTVIGKFNGEFWGMFASTQLIGNLLSLALLSGGTGGSTSGTTLLFIVFLCSMTLGTVLMCFLQKRDGKGEESLPDSSVSFYSSIISLSKSVITPLCDLRMLLIIPLIAYSGLQQAFVWAEFTKDIVEPALGVSGVAGAMVVYGAFDAICSLTVGRLTSGLKSVTLIVSAGAFIQFIVFLWILLKYCLTSEGLGTVYLFLIAAALGIGDGVLNTQLSALLGMLFKHDTEGAFAQLKVWQSASIAVVFFMSPYISLLVMLVVMVAAVCIAVVGFLFLTLQVERAFSSHDADI